MKKIVLTSLLCVLVMLSACAAADDDGHLFSAKTNGKTVYFGMPVTELTEAFEGVTFSESFGTMYSSEDITYLDRDGTVVFIQLNGSFETNLGINSGDSKDKVEKTMEGPTEEFGEIYSYYFEANSDGELLFLTTDAFQERHKKFETEDIYMVTITFEGDKVTSLDFGDYLASARMM